MIDFQTQMLGGPEVARMLRDREGALRVALVDELTRIGEEIRSRAAAAAPKRTGDMASRVVWFFGTRAPRKNAGGKTLIRDVKWKSGKINFSVMATGRVAHLVERGVNASFYQRPGRRGRDKVRPGRKLVGPYAGEAVQGPAYRYRRTLLIRPRPFFMPAVETVGGLSAVNARLQAVVDRIASGRAA